MFQPNQISQVSSLDSQMIVDGLPDEQQLRKEDPKDCQIFFPSRNMVFSKENLKNTEDVENSSQQKERSQIFQEQNSFQIYQTQEKEVQEIEILQDLSSESKSHHQQEEPKKGRRKKKNKRTPIKKKKTSDTKNIPKNYGKQIIKFILKTSKKLTERVLKYSKSKYSFEQLQKELKKIKKKFNKIQDLRNIWFSKDFSTEIRILSGLFLRKHSLNWIFNSRIQTIPDHLKYRYKVMEGVKNPEKFQSIKQF